MTDKKSDIFITISYVLTIVDECYYFSFNMLNYPTIRRLGL